METKTAEQKKERARQYAAQYRINHADLLRWKRAEYARANPGVKAARERARMEANPEIAAARRAKRLARYYANPEKFISDARQWAIANPERRRQTETNWYRKTPAYQLWRHAKARAKAQGVAFELKPEDVIIPSVCPILNIPLVVGTSKRHLPNSPTIDRTIPSLGYIKENITVMSHRANRLKSDATLEELEAIIAFVKREAGW